MSVDLAVWNYGLVFASICTILGIIGIVSVQRSEDRLLASGLFLQGLILIFGVGGAHFPNSVDLRLSGLILAGLLIAQTLLGPTLDTAEQPQEEDGPG